jgi:hypothetical protein
MAPTKAMADNKNALTFSQRMGIVPIRKVLQADSMDEELRNGLWNILTQILWKPLQAEHKISEYRNVGGIVSRVWTNHLKRPVDTLTPYSSEVVTDFRHYFFNCFYNEVYEFIEFVRKRS